MITKHFLKTLFIFICIIALTLLGIYFVGELDGEENGESTTGTILNFFEE